MSTSPMYEGRPLARPNDDVEDQGLTFDIQTILTRRRVGPQLDRGRDDECDGERGGIGKRGASYGDGWAVPGRRLERSGRARGIRH